MSPPQAGTTDFRHNEAVVEALYGTAEEVPTRGKGPARGGRRPYEEGPPSSEPIEAVLYRASIRPRRVAIGSSQRERRELVR